MRYNDAELPGRLRRRRGICGGAASRCFPFFLRPAKRLGPRGFSVESQSVQLFKLKNRWGLTALSVVLCLLAAPFSMLGMFMPRFVTLLPALALLLLGYVGPVSAFACCAVFVGLCAVFYGAMGAVCMALLMLPPVVAACVTAQRRMGFFLSCGILAAVLFASLGAILGAISFMAKADVVTALSGMIGSVFDGMGEMADPILLTFAQMGVVSLPDGMSLQQLSEGMRLTAAARGEMIASIVYMLDLGLRLELPMQMTVGSLGAGVLGQAVLRRGVRSRGIEVPYVPLRKWRLPSGWGRVLGITLAALFVAAQLLPERLSVMAYVFGGIFTELFALQGIAAFSYMLHSRGKRLRWTALVFALGYTVARTPAMVVGIADQAFDFVHRRAALDAQDNPYDPRAKL